MRWTPSRIRVVSLSRDDPEEVAIAIGAAGWALSLGRNAFVRAMYERTIYNLFTNF
jgi:hypothetical protein